MIPTFEPIKRQNAVLIFVDMQAGPLATVGSMDADALRANALSVARISRLLGVPVILAGAAIPGSEGEFLPELTAALPDAVPIRHATNNAWETPDFVRAVEQTNCPHLVFAGVATDVGVLLPAVSAAQAGYPVRVLVDVSATLNARIEQAAWLRLAQAGVLLTSWTAFTGEIQHNYTEEPGPQLRAIIGENLNSTSGPFAPHPPSAAPATVASPPGEPPLAGKVALVTGASRGIGRAIAEKLGRLGASVVVNYWQSADKAADVVATIEQSGSRAVAVRGDVRQVADIRRLFQTAIEQFGQIDILVNNAGGGITAPLTDLTEAQYEEQFAFNTKSALFAMQEAAHHLADNGRIINISATLTLYGVAGAALYGGSKRAMEYFTLAGARELGSRGITVNTVSPGGVETDVYRANAPAVQRQAAQSSPLGRMGHTDDIADVVAFLASPNGRWLTGQTLLADGGVRM